MYGSIEKENNNQFVDSDKIVFGGVTVYWCVTCEFNKIVALDSIRTLGLFKRKHYFIVR